MTGEMLSKEKWYNTFVRDIAFHHGFLSYTEFEQAMLQIDPEFNRRYSSYEKSFEITKSPLWQALK